MGVSQEAEESRVRRESIEVSLGLPAPAPAGGLQLKLFASEDERHRLQDLIFLLEDRLRDSNKRIEKHKAEASMNERALRRRIEEQKAAAAELVELTAGCAKLEEECALYERDLEHVVELRDELAKENEELRARLVDRPSIEALVSEVESLQKYKKNLRINLQRAEEEVQLLFEENNILDEENRKLLRQLKREKRHQESGSQSSASTSAKEKRKSSSTTRSPSASAIGFNETDSSRQPLSSLHQNSPDPQVHKK